MAVTQKPDVVALPGAAAYRAWQEAGRRRHDLRVQLQGAVSEQARVRNEADRFQTAALEAEGRLLLGDAKPAELNTANAAAEAATTKARELEVLSARLRQELADLEKELPDLQRRGERAEAEAAKALRAMHEEAVKDVVAALRALVTANKREIAVRNAGIALLGRVGGYIYPLAFEQDALSRGEEDPNSDLAIFIKQARQAPGCAAGGYKV